MSSTSAGYRIAFLDHDLMLVFSRLFDVVCLKTVTYVTIYDNINWTNLEGVGFESLQVALAIAFFVLTGPWARRHSMVALQYLAQWLLGQVQRHLQNHERIEGRTAGLVGRCYAAHVLCGF